MVVNYSRQTHTHTGARGMHVHVMDAYLNGERRVCCALCKMFFVCELTLADTAG